MFTGAWPWLLSAKPEDSERAPLLRRSLGNSVMGRWDGEQAGSRRG